LRSSRGGRSSRTGSNKDCDPEPASAKLCWPHAKERLQVSSRARARLRVPLGAGRERS
jgi:hypothetical protein